MWEECFRTGLERVLARLDISPLSETLGKLAFWLARELAWWWIVSIMVAFLLSFLAELETVRGLARLSKRYLSAARAP